MTYIAPFITRQEYECSCCGSLPPDLEQKEYIYQELFKSFETLRKRTGKSILITSGYRCPKHNKEIGGVTYSAHIFGVALDIACADLNDLNIKEYILRSVNPDLRIGVYPDQLFIHMDTAYNIVPRITKDWQRGVNWRTEVIK